MHNQELIPPLEGWLSLNEAAERVGITRQGIWAAAKRGQITGLRRLGQAIAIPETEVARYASRPQVQDDPFAEIRRLAGYRPTIQQANFLLDKLHGRRNADYSWFIATAKALSRRGLLGDGSRLTEKGRAVAVALDEMQRPSDGSQE